MQMTAARGGGLDTWEEKTEAFLCSCFSGSPVTFSPNFLTVVVVVVVVCLCGQGHLACCSPWGHKEVDTTEPLNKGPRPKKGPQPKKGPRSGPLRSGCPNLPRSFPAFGTTSVQEYGGGRGEADPWP